MIQESLKHPIHPLCHFMEGAKVVSATKLSKMADIWGYMFLIITQLRQYHAIIGKNPGDIIHLKVMVVQFEICQQPAHKRVAD